jgi:hypothetical protein
MRFSISKPTSLIQVVKLVMIPILGYVLYAQLPSLNNTTNSTEQEPCKRRVGAQCLTERPTINWPNINQAELVSYNPFELPVGLRISEPDPIAPPTSADPMTVSTNTEATPTVEEFKLDDVQAIIQSAQGSMVLINNQTYRVGDEIRPGLVIAAIHGQSIEVQRVAIQSP